MTDGLKEGKAAREWRRDTQKTFYTDRIFILYEPHDFRNYLRKLATPESSTGNLTRSERLEADIGLDAWATVLIYRSRLLLWDFKRQVFALFHEGRFNSEKYPLNPLGSPAERQAITMQLAIEAMTNRSYVRARIDENPFHARLIYDTLYYTSELHPSEIGFRSKQADADIAEESDAVSGVRDFDPGKLQAYLASVAEISSSGAEQIQNDGGSPDDFLGRDVLYGYLKEYLDLLADPAEIRKSTIEAATRLEPREAIIRRALADAIDLEPLVKIEPTTAAGLRVRFTRDRYGSRREEGSFDLRVAVDALRGALDLMEATFADIGRAWELAVEAGLSPAHPSWSAIKGYVDEADRALVSARPNGDGTQDSQSENTRLADLIKWTLRRLQAFAEVFRLGLPLVLLGSLAAPTGTPAERRMTGLMAVARVYRLGAREDLVDTQYVLMAVEGAEAVLGKEPAYRQYLDLKNAPRLANRDFESDPAGLGVWAADMMKTVATFDAARLDLSTFEEAYWGQWKVVGNELERVGGAAQPGELDLLHAAAHGGVPVIPSRVDPFSICELSRLWLSCRSQSDKTPNSASGPIADFALRMLVGDATPVRAPGQRRAVRISPLTVDSPAWSWRPEPGLSASALMPPDAGHPTWPAMQEEELFSLVRRGAASIGAPEGNSLPIKVLALVEGTNAGRRSGPFRTVYFGYGAPPAESDRYHAQPTGLAQLVADIERQDQDRGPRGGAAGMIIMIYRRVVLYLRYSNRVLRRALWGGNSRSE